MEQEKKFCHVCKQLIQEESIVSTLFGGKKVFEFEDGYYCEKCATVKVNKERKK